ncbi:hypothetical protein ACIPYQ_10645 [Streptomyces sp. NPDC090045]|uniref:hypothetical protein n=1 Tax=Streptomyces sp. NPDC090045 TaxID=3365927 RepID=UPI0037F1826A
MSQWISLIELVGSLAGAATAAFTLVTAIAEARHRFGRGAARPGHDDNAQDGE